MSKIRKLLILSLFVCMTTSSIFGTESRAEGTSGEQTTSVSGLKDENAQRLEEVTAMDQDGNISIVDDSEGVIEDSKMSRYYRSAGGVKIVNFNTKGNALTEYTEYDTGAAGYTNGAFGADAAYLGMSGGKVKFMMSGVVGLVNASEVQVVDLSSVAVYSCYEVSNGRLMHNIVYNMTTPGYATKLDNGPAPSYLSSGVKYYSYDGHYFYKDYGTMLDDYQKDTRSRSVNAGSPYYNYFQYLPLRSQTSYDANTLNSLINSRIVSGSKMQNTGNLFAGYQDTYGVNALVMASIAANESGWGKSDISQRKNNLFGLNAVDTSAGTSSYTYATVDECIRQFASGYMSKGYLRPADWRYNGGFLGNKASGIGVRYASDPFWGEKAANVMWNLDKSAGSADAQKYTLGVKDTISTQHTSVNVRNGGSTSATSLYMTGKASNYSVLILDSQASNSFYRIQSDPVLNGDRSAVNKSAGEYNFADMYAYIPSNSVQIVNNGSNVPAPEPTPEPEPVVLQSVSISTPPSKTTYTEGEIFDASGMIVKAQWSDGSEKDVTADAEFSKEALTKDMKSVTVQYTSNGVTKAAQQALTVNEKATVTNITITPSSVEMKAGGNRTFGITVSGTGKPSQNVTWSVEGAKSTDTNIDGNGKLQIGADETAEAITVKAVSTVDTSKAATAAVKVIQEPAKDPDGDTPDSDTPDSDTPDADIPDQDEPDQNTSDENPDTTTPDTATDVKDEATGVWVSGKVPEGVKLTVIEIGEDNENYVKLTDAEAVKNRVILGVYDINLDKELGENESVQLGFIVDSAYEGKTVVVLHYAEKDGDNNPIVYKTDVKDGKAVIDVEGFSPYVIALDEEKEAEPPVVTPDNTIPNPPSNDLTPSGEPSDGAGDEPSGETPVVTPTEGNNSNNDLNGSGQEVVPAETTPVTGDGQSNNTETVQPDDNNKAKQTVPEAKPSDNSQKKAPKTGDVNHTAGWIMLLITAIACMAVSVLRIRKAHIN